MQHSSFPLDPLRLPKASDPDRARRGIERWLETAARHDVDGTTNSFARALADDVGGRALLEAIFGNSPFLGHCLLSEIGFGRILIEQGPDLVLADLLSRLGDDLDREGDTVALMRALRRARRKVALAVALADISGSWELDQVTGTLSAFAERAVRMAVRHLLRGAAADGDLRLATPEDPEAGSGYILIAMGKLGARELNYSSDIDLIALFDRDRVVYTGKRTVEHCFIRMTRRLVALLQDRTEEGYVFRVDLRLRPDPGSTPAAMSVVAAETYYESMGQNWERAAMIKARPLAGDRDAGARFLAHLRPYVWRKNLDFAAIRDVHSIKRQIHAHKGHQAIAVGGHDIKLGRGGIREIEFFAQTQQLIWGGRMPELRVADTVGALAALAHTGRIGPTVADTLSQSYRFLRRIEHRLQMIDDHQTQTLPPEGPELDSLAGFAGYPDAAAFHDDLTTHLRRVEAIYADLFEEQPELSGPGNLVFTGSDADPETVRTLERMGFGDGTAISATIRAWHHGRYRATRSTRARELLTELMPTLLQALARTAHADTAFAKFDEFLRNLPAGVPLFSMIYANPGLLDLLAEILGGAPRLAEQLSRRPHLLEAVLAPGFFERPPPVATLATEIGRVLDRAETYEDALDISRRWVNDRRFQVGCGILTHALDATVAGSALSDIADTALAALHPHVLADLARRHGCVPGPGLAIVALGKLGGREMTVTSDLDLIFVYEVEPGIEVSDGAKALAPAHYFARAAQRLINAYTAPTAEGSLYEVDMRLRPSGNAGPIASNLEGFLRYQEGDAWTWEHMALTRARVVVAEPGFGRRVEAAIRHVLARPRDGAKLLRDVVAMRRRMEQHHKQSSIWDVKHAPGGLVDIEFVAQYLMLRHAHARPDVLQANTAAALGRLAAAGVLAPTDAEALIEALLLWCNLQGLLRLTTGGGLDDPDAVPEALKRRLAEAGQAIDFAELQRKMVAAAERARGCWERIVGDPARLAEETDKNEEVE